MRGEEIERHLRFLQSLEREALGTLQEWMRRVDAEDCPQPGLTEARLCWLTDDGYAGLREASYGENIAVYRFSISVERIEHAPAEILTVADGMDVELQEHFAPPEHAPQWVPRTWRDVVTGDRVRMPGTEVTATVTMRLRHPSEDPFGRVMHVVPGEHHWDDHVVQPGECCVVLDHFAPRFMNPNAAVEIELSPAEVDAIEALPQGWKSRLAMDTR